MDQSIEQLNDVTAVSGVNLREEEEQLFSEASQKVVQQEEERLILQNIPLKRNWQQTTRKREENTFLRFRG